MPEIGQNLFAVSFNLGTLEVADGQVPVIEGVYKIAPPLCAISDSGALVYVPGTTIAATQLGRRCSSLR